MMTEELQRMWDVQLLDEKAAVLRTTLDRFPGERQQAETRLAGERARLAAQKEKAMALQKQRRDLELQAEAFTEQERKFKSQLPQVKKNEEYTALLKEIEEAKQKRSEVETRILEALDNEEAIESERNTIEKALRELETQVKKRLDEIAQEEDVDNEKLAALDRERAGKLEGVPPATRSRYERVRASRHTRAIVPIAKGACGGCYRALPPQVLQQARRGDQLISCEGCGRLLILPPETA